MKRVRVFAGVLVLALLVVPIGWAGANDSGINAGTWDLIFDGFCDGLNINYAGATGIATGMYSSSCSSCPETDRLAGTAGFVASQGGAITLAFETIGGTSPAWIYTVVRKDHTWTHYNWDGSVFVSGTWSFCTEGKAPEGAPHSTGFR
jgi:hypothetical protein